MYSLAKMERYLFDCIGMTLKKAASLVKIRTAFASYVDNPAKFNYDHWGYNDASHFYKEVKRFTKDIDTPSNH